MDSCEVLKKVKESRHAQEKMKEQLENIKYRVKNTESNVESIQYTVDNIHTDVSEVSQALEGGIPYTGKHKEAPPERGI